MCVILQPGGAATRRNWRSVGAEDIPSAAHTEAGSFSAGAALPAVRHAEDDGQRRHLLRSARALHIHFQVLYSLEAQTHSLAHGSTVVRVRPRRGSRPGRIYFLQMEF